MTATGVLRSKAGEFRFDLESATVAGMEVPKSLLQELVSYYTKSDVEPVRVQSRRAVRAVGRDS